jgi:hypothetical protein
MNSKHLPFGAGVAAWILGLIALFVLSYPLSSPETVSNALIWSISYWWIAYVIGLATLIVVALLKKIPMQASLIGYVAPVAVMAVLALICLGIYPNAGFREDLLGYMPVAVVFYLISWLWVRFSGQAESKEGDALRTLVPPLVGGVMILVLVVVPVFMSNAFIYRNAFTLDVLKIQRPGNSLTVECVLEIHKPGDYDFRVPPFFYFDMMEPEDIDDGDRPSNSVTWGESGKPKPGSTGRFPVVISWDNIPSFAMDELTGTSPGALPILLEVRAAARPDEILYTVSSTESEL